ncbi:aldehyde dehydrogenase [Neomoorella humiferrea]|uniref:aldehyde dehydrogenase n=1 Tax=Neomoorella humiferrea TaxID=676965 RepID=UPI003D911200
MDELEKRISLIVERVLEELMAQQGVPVSPSLIQSSKAGISTGTTGIFNNVQEALVAAREAQRKLVSLSITKREAIIASMRAAALAEAEHLARMAWEETGLGRFEDKIAKNKYAAELTPGIEDLPTETYYGPEETVIVEYGPYGLTASITPVTNPTSTVINHAIGLLAGGNSVFFAPHPNSKKCVQETIKILNRAIIEAGGPANLIVTVAEPSLEKVQEVLKYDDVKLVIATGGAGLVKAALASGKKCVAGGPGNPPVVVDETADLKLAAKAITAGASFDNNILCTCEKVLIVVDLIAEDFLQEMLKGPVVYLDTGEGERLTKTLIENGHINKKFVGKNPSVILQTIGKKVDDSVRLIVMETAPEHPLVQLEQLMPVLPIVRVNDFETAVKMAKEIEHGFRHTASIYTNDLTRVTKYAEIMEVTLLLHNKPSFAGLGVNGAGKYTSTLAGPTGEGVTTARTFTRQRRYVAPNCAL